MAAMEWIATTRKRRVLAAYVSMLAAAAGLFFLIVHFGASLTPHAPAKLQASGDAVATPASPLFHVLLALAAVIVTARLLNV